ncbi:MAG TPA: MlaD family protein [Vicinamibacterales bacterium]|nr:MlaD family protein [Vicinamibacterales bacterium]
MKRLAAVGAFVIGGILLFAIGLFLIGSRRMMFGDTFRLYAEFAEVASLENGAKVRVAGMDAGEIEEIKVPAGPSAKFRVRMRVRSDLHPIIRLDSVATIQSDGLVGNKYLQIQAGTERSPIVPDQGTILSREPFDFTDLLQKMSNTIDTVNTTVVSLKGEIDDALGSITDTAATARALIDDVGVDTRAILASSQKVSADLQTMVAGVKEGRGSLGKLINDDSLFQNAQKIASDAQRAMADVRTAAGQAKDAIAELRGQSGPIKGLAGNLTDTLTAARSVMADLEDATEALKRNFLLRGFFTRRGYYDLDDVSVDQYRQGVLQTKERRALRIWIRGDLLFERDAKGAEHLTEDGQRRIDSAMAQFVKYPKTSPFVIEGYADRPTADDRFLLSRSRAQLVRDYIVGKFGLNPNFVTTMPLGREAKDSPAGDTWDGVALAMFVPRAAL